MTNTNIVLGTEVKVTFNNDGYVLTGKVVDFTENMRYILIENEVDTFNIDTQKATVEVVTVEEVKAPEIHFSNAEVKAEITSLTKYMDDYTTYMEVYEEEDMFDVNVNVTEEGEYVDGITAATFYNKADAMAFARKLRTAVKRYAEMQTTIVESSL
ncbi:hypothetical protein [Bacillus cereus group sp. MYBK215-1]|uniref:hypothetical protein n=1 Tax=unclassified Bacillus cereus group TaxID=2750818 RepID=UPI003F7928AC